MLFVENWSSFEASYMELTAARPRNVALGVQLLAVYGLWGYSWGYLRWRVCGISQLKQYTCTVDVNALCSQKYNGASRLCCNLTAVSLLVPAK